MTKIKQRMEFNNFILFTLYVVTVNEFHYIAPSLQIQLHDKMLLEHK